MEEKKRRGNQNPTVWSTLPYQKTHGQNAIDLYEGTGRTAQEWQINLIYDMLAYNDDEEKSWTHSRFGYSVPRQNGKNEVIAIRELWGLTEGERILHTAHRTSTSTAAWKRLEAFLEDVGIHEIKGDCKVGYKDGKSKGQEFIQLSEEYGGGIIQFRTRTTTGGLGESYDTLIIDEAQEYQTDQESALKYTIAAANNPQTILLGTPPTAYSSGTIFPAFRRKALCKDIKNAGWEEWSVEEMTSPNDVDAWYKANPSLGFRLKERTIEDEIGEDDVDFNIQRLGLWISYNQHSAISKVDWDKLRVDRLPRSVGKMCVGIKFNRDGSTVSMAIALKTNDERVFIEAIGCQTMRDGIQWLFDFCASAKDSINRIVIDGANGLTMFEEGSKKLKLKSLIVAPKVAEYIDANALFEQDVYQKHLVHMNQPGLRNIATNCEKRPIGSGGGFGFKSQNLYADSSILDAVILASWGVQKFKERKRQQIRY